MYPKQSNPTHKGRAPYNFVPLPDKVVAVNVEKIPKQDKYTNNTGYIDCLLTTKSPLYTRCAMSPEFFKEDGDTPFYKLDPDDKKNERGQFFHLKDEECPLIPGSSLRGMVRALVEIASYGKMQWVTNDTKITYRAVAKDDPLTELYKQVLGKSGQNVQVGYLVNNGDDWSIHPAKKASDLNLQGKESFLKIKEKIIPSGAIPGFINLNDKNYIPQYHEVRFDAKVESGENGKYNKITSIGSVNTEHQYLGVLVCSGNMLETDNKGSSPSPRKNHVLVLEKSDAKELKISTQALLNYKASLTPFQKKPPFDERMGCLKNGRPIFYIPNSTGEVLYFGHSPNFRIPSIISEDKCITSPMDFVPKSLKSENVTDLAEAIFGYIDKDNMPARAGRVFFTDAEYKSARDDNIWLTEEPLTPNILASPKPTTFQHYLVQDREKGHDPDDRRMLAHYGTPSPNETVIRGCKMYWHKGDISLEDIKANPMDFDKSKKQYTRIRPVNTGVTFSFRIYFENLREHELGALLWVLKLPDDKKYHNKLGMGKPLGMGAVKIEPELYLSDHIKRYKRLFDGNNWAEDVSLCDPKPIIRCFEDYILDSLQLGDYDLKDVERIKILLKMLEWSETDRNSTRYLGPAEYKNRNVLPDPLNVEHNQH